MPVEIGYVPAGAAMPTHGVEVPSGLPSSTTDVLISAPKTMSVLYAVLAVEKRTAKADQIVAAHHAGVNAALSVLNSKASSALVYRGARHYTPQQRLAEMLEREPDAIPERREELARQASAELRDPTIVEHVESTGLRINQLFHLAHNQGRGDPHLHTHLFVDAEVTALDDARDYPRDPSALWSAVEHMVMMYDAGASQTLSASLGVKFWANDRTGRRELDGFTEDVVAAYAGVRCLPDNRFQQVVAANFVGYSL